jgi:hypothetical protein
MERRGIGSNHVYMHPPFLNSRPESEGWSADRKMHMTASQYFLDSGVLDFSVGCACVVSHQLFPHGKHWFTLCRKIWNQPVVGLDDGLEAGHSVPMMVRGGRLKPVVAVQSLTLAASMI